MIIRMGELHTPTIQIAMTMVCFISTVVIFAVWRSTDRVQGMGHWTVSIALLGISFLMLGYRGILPDYLGVVGSVIVLTVGLCLFYRGARLFSQSAGSIHFETACISIVTVAFLYFTYVQPHIGIRAMVLALVAAVISLAIIGTFWPHRKAPWRFAALGIISIFALLVVGLSARIFIIASNFDEYSYQTNTSVPILNLFFLFVQTALTLFLMSLSNAFLYSELLSHTEKLEQSNSELSQFAYITSHDLKEPLRTISNYSRLLSEKRTDDLDEITANSLRFINEASLRMHQLIEALLEHSRIGRDPEPIEINCVELVDSVVGDLNALIEESGATVTKKFLPTIQADETEVRLLFQNLLSNGIKFSRPEESPKLNVGAVRNGNFWEFFVEDNGIGIERDYHEKIFTIFSRLHDRKEYEGTGIGLAHCKKIVDTLGGNIWLESTVGAGTTFFFTIPIIPRK